MNTEVSRRMFLRVAATGSVGLAVTNCSAIQAAESPPRRKFTMALSCGAIGVQASPREAIDLAQRFGFEAVEPAAEFLGQLSDDALAELMAEMKARKLVWAAAGLPVEFRNTDAVFQDSLQRLPDFARKLQRADVTRVGTWLSPSHGSLTYVANFRRHVQRLREVAKVLADHGLRLGLEYVGPKTSWSAGRFPFIHTMAEMKDLIAEMGCPNVGFTLDSWHWYTAEETRADLVSLRNTDVICCHLNDAPPGIPVDQQMDNRRDLPAATGVIDLKAFLGALAEIGYDGPIMAEPFRPDLRS
ncbi:MAG: sugar phosphate isomerase/epimerase, partial [Planctomycetes bacterium]|nr:sugar phosphate isomerase/epimerase [Planctomycetota bacterium]